MADTNPDLATIETKEEAQRYEPRAFSQRWPRAGTQTGYTVRCPICKHRQRLAWWNWGDPAGREFYFGFSCCNQQRRFVAGTLPDPPPMPASRTGRRKRFPG